MYILHILVFITSILLLVNALPPKSPKSPKTYTIPLKKKSISNSLILHYASGSYAATNIKRSTDVSLANEFSNDDAYFCEITFGKHEQKFNVMIDTGFGDVLIPSINCTSAGCENKAKYNPINDTSFKTTNKSFGYDYLGGNVFGIRGTTTSMNVSGYISGINTTGLHFGLVSVFPKRFEFDEFDGIIGLAPEDDVLITPHEENFVDNLGEDFLDPNQIFSLKIGRHADQTESELTIGGIDPNKYTGELVYTQIAITAGQYYWTIFIDGFTINNNSLSFQRRIGRIVSGLSPIIVPFDDVHKIYQQIPNATENDGIFRIPCGSELKVKIKIGGVDWGIDQRDLISVRQLRNRQKCHGMIIGGITENNEWILGTTFLKNVYSVYYSLNHKIGFAKLNVSSLNFQ
ncbi:aspartic peptidase domain-containing protein [Gigaspora rosea]|uniref:Aspartic peptidase domain-containing protein n=1 Tax=Gigaspora rosea TaxID=44941 RepID=A0A397W4A6_9GLOM|nr:aspartic peptidase domain-containing protein [Gigaspora rosea]